MSIVVIAPVAAASKVLRGGKPITPAGKVLTHGTPLIVVGIAPPTVVIGPQRAQKVLDGIHARTLRPAGGTVILQRRYPITTVRAAPRAVLSGQPVSLTVTLHVVPHAVLTGWQPHLKLLLGAG
jgi:hypothetical protein